MLLLEPPSDVRSHEDRIACPWLIENFIDPDAGQVLELGDHRRLELSLPVNDALYARYRNEVGRA